MTDTDGKFFLGRSYDLKARDVTQDTLLYDPDDLTTHGVCVGMTGSGKTGLCIDLLEEAALQNIPALLIDPKGDMTNTLLHFPELLPEDFQPWINPDEARRDNKSVEQAAQDTAGLWQKGLGKWGIDGDRIQALKDSAHFAIYTPGSYSGIPVSILSSFEAPLASWEDNQELFREKISSTVTAVLGLVGLQDIDPVQSREHILISNILETSWRKGVSMDLGELIMQVQNPPFTKLGVFDVNTFFPQKDRFALAMQLNNILAAPAFQTWIEGQPLDIPELMYGDDGKPRHSVFYIAHLTEEERMFFVTLLYSAVESWMRSQKGSSTLRLILYFDEIFGYLPPISNPPSKEVMLRMLKQARAFGVGQMLVTQNPVDVDYKALSNAGTWFIGKLQTDQDKQRLLDGLESVIKGGLDRKQYDKLISSLDKRVFLVKNVHESEPALFHTRWAMNYLAGPMTRTQVPELNKLAGAAQPILEERTTADVEPVGAPAPKKETISPEDDSVTGSVTRPAVPSRVSEFFLPKQFSLSRAFDSAGKVYPEDLKTKGLLYKPVLLAQAHIRFLNRKYDLDQEMIRTALVLKPDRRGVVRWDEELVQPVEEASLESQPEPEARFTTLEVPLSDSKIMSSLKSDFLDWAYRESEVIVRVNEELEVFADPSISDEQFQRMCEDAAEEAVEAEIEKVTKAYAKKIKVIQDRMEREERELQEDESELSARKMEEWSTHAEGLFSLIGGRRSSTRVSKSMTKRRMTAKAKADVKESLEQIEEYEEDIAELQEELDEELEEIKDKWELIISQHDEIKITPYKKDVNVDLFGVAWLPYFRVKAGSELVELPAFKTE